MKQDNLRVAEDCGRIVEAVLFAHAPGMNTIRGDIIRAVKRAIFRCPPILRRQLMFGVMQLHGGFRLGGALGKSNTFENDLMKLIFNATTISGMARDDAAPVTSLHCSLHTGADPTDTMDQTTQEIAYTTYARIPVLRTSGGWTVSGNAVVPVAVVDFPIMTAGAGGTATYGAIGTLLTAAGKVLYYGALSPTIAVVNGVIPRWAVTSTATED